MSNIQNTYSIARIRKNTEVDGRWICDILYSWLSTTSRFWYTIFEQDGNGYILGEEHWLARGVYIEDIRGQTDLETDTVVAVVDNKDHSIAYWGLILDQPTIACKDDVANHLIQQTNQDLDSIEAGVSNLERMLGGPKDRDARQDLFFTNINLFTLIECQLVKLKRADAVRVLPHNPDVVLLVERCKNILVKAAVLMNKIEEMDIAVCQSRGAVSKFKDYEMEVYIADRKELIHVADALLADVTTPQP